MKKYNSISQFLESGGFDYRVFDMGRKVWEIPPTLFLQIENQKEQYPYPFQQNARLALLFWPVKNPQESVIWFLQFPIDELGFLKQASRDAFLIDLLEQTGKNIQAKQQGQKTKDGLRESPFAYKPREDRLAMFHAFATNILNQVPSQHYQYAHDYLKPKSAGGPGYEQWQFLGLQGLADVVARLNSEGNEDLLMRAIPEMPELPLSSYVQSLENVELGSGLFNALIMKIKTEVVAEDSNVLLIATLIRAISSYPDSAPRIELLKSLLGKSLANEIEIFAAISGRCWNDLKDEDLLKLFLEKLALHEQVAFSAIITDLIMIPGMRDLILEVVRGESRSAELAKKFDVFTEDFNE